jgi:hypothetical protein
VHGVSALSIALPAYLVTVSRNLHESQIELHRRFQTVSRYQMEILPEYIGVSYDSQNK